MKNMYNQTFFYFLNFGKKLCELWLLGLQLKQKNKNSQIQFIKGNQKISLSHLPEEFKIFQCI